MEWCAIITTVRLKERKIHLTTGVKSNTNPEKEESWWIINVVSSRAGFWRRIFFLLGICGKDSKICNLLCKFIFVFEIVVWRHVTCGCLCCVNMDNYNLTTRIFCRFKPQIKLAANIYYQNTWLFTDTNEVNMCR